MAGGKLSPRQKMVNLMYLVFIAMLALNMSKEVLTAFGILNNKIVESNAIADGRNESSFLQLAQKAQDQPKQFGPKKEKVEKIRALSKEFNTYIQKLKDEFTKEYPLDEQGNLPFEQMDKGDGVDEKWFGGDKPKPAGNEFLEKISNYVAQLKKIGGSAITEGEMKKIEKRFSTEKVFSKAVGKKVDWLDYNFKGYPLIATITKLSQLQADVKTTESDIIAGMFQSDLVAAASLTAYQPIVVPEKTAFFQGEAVKGKIILGKFDPNLVAKSVIVNGSSVKAEAGQANFSFGAGAVGEHEITGSFNFDENGKVVSLPIKGNYVVVPKPNSAAISSDNMKIIYQEVDNPMSISFGGVQNNNVTATGAGLRKVGNDGKYIWNVGKFKEKTISITVNAKLPDGKSVSDVQTFKVRPVPAPALTINGGSGLVIGKAGELSDATLGITFGRFGEDYKISGKVTSVNLLFGGKTFDVSSQISSDPKVVAALKALPKGSTVLVSATYRKNNGETKSDAYSCTFKIN
jgi:gliding motility-associated protein GldM